MTESIPARSTHQTSPAPHDSDEIDLIQLAHTIWSGRRTIFKTMAIFTVLGIIVALYSPSEYTASTTIIPQLPNGQSRMGGLTGLAAMAGINLDAGSAAEFAPPIYPQIVSSIPFQLELMQTMLNFKDIDKPISLSDYYTNYDKPSPVIKYTLGLPGLLLKAINDKQREVLPPKDNSPLRITQSQQATLKKLKELISVEYNDEDGYVTLSSRMPEALPAAQVTQRVQELLQQYITEFKIQKAKANLHFIQQRYNEIKKQTEQAQEALAHFRDRNRNVATATAQTELERLNSNYNLIYGIYSELAKQLEQARIQVKEDTPVLTVIKPVFVPLERSKPRRAVILVIWVFLGGIAGIGMILGRKFFGVVKRLWPAH